MHALAIHPGALGDVLLAVPALRAFAAAGEEPVTVAAQPHVGAALTALGLVAGAVPFEALRLDALFVDDPASVPRLPRVARVVSWFGARDPVYVRRLHECIPRAIVAPSTADGLVWKHLLATLGNRPGEWRAAIDVPARLRDAGAALLGEAGWDGAAPLVIAHPGASGAAKRWPAEAFATVLEAASSAGARIALQAGPLDADPVAELAARLATPPLVLRSPTLSALGGALTRATAFIGNDSGVSHLAAAVGAASVIVAAPQNAAWASWSESAMTVAVALDRTRADEVIAVREALLRTLARSRAAA